MATPELLVVARVQRPHGLSGEVSVEVRTDFPERFTPGENLVWRRDQAPERSLRLIAARPHGARMLLTFEGVGDVDAARALAGGDLCVPAARAHPAPEGFYYSHEIEGFACEDAAGHPLGSAVGLEQTPAGPLLSIAGSNGREALVPFVDEFVVRIDRESRRIVLALPEGLLEL